MFAVEGCYASAIVYNIMKRMLIVNLIVEQIKGCNAPNVAKNVMKRMLIVIPIVEDGKACSWGDVTGAGVSTPLLDRYTT